MVGRHRKKAKFTLDFGSSVQGIFAKEGAPSLVAAEARVGKIEGRPYAETVSRPVWEHTRTSSIPRTRPKRGENWVFPTFLALTVACRRMGAGLINGIRSGHRKFRLQQRSYRTCAGWAVLTAYSLFLVFRVHAHDTAGRPTNLPLWGRQDSCRLVGWIGERVLGLCAFCRRE